MPRQKHAFHSAAMQIGGDQKPSAIWEGFLASFLFSFFSRLPRWCSLLPFFQEFLEGGFAESVHAAEFYRFNLSLLDVFEDSEGVDLQDFGHLLRGVYFFIHFLFVLFFPRFWRLFIIFYLI